MEMVSRCTLNTHKTLTHTPPPEKKVISFGHILTSNYVNYSMPERDYSGTWDLFQMLLNTLYFHYMRYRTDTMTQTREKWLRSQKV